MTPRCSRWAGPVLAMVAAFALSACGGGNVSTTPSVQSFNQSAGIGADNLTRPSVTTLNVQPNVKCPKKYLTGCDTVSKKKGLVIHVVLGTKKHPCADTNKVTWSGVVCDAKGKTCKKPIKQMTAAWSGPFKCKKKDMCGSKGYFELDTITPGKGLKPTKKYVYKQDIHYCAGSSCGDVYIGLNVSK